MTDNSYIIRAKTRRELKAAVAYEAARYRNADYVGANKRAIAEIAAIAWRNAKTRKDHLSYSLPVAPPHARTTYCEAVFVGNATRAEYLAYERECEQ